MADAPRGAGGGRLRAGSGGPENAGAAFADLHATLEQRRSRVETALREVAFPLTSGAVSQAVEYALFSGAKRLRPILSLMVADLFGTPHERVVPGACAIEMVHTASLILDDLPAMDDARLRRGRPACHVSYGEATAILAAFALINRSFELLAQGWREGPDAQQRVALSQSLARAVGLDGMIAGQALDLEMTGRRIDLKTLEFIHSRKTGALFMASAELGATDARATAAERAAVIAYAKNLGLAFQIVDDVIDATGRSEDSGKDVGRDEAKTTFVSFAGVDGSLQLAGELIGAAQDALAACGTRAHALHALASYVLLRKK